MYRKHEHLYNKQALRAKIGRLTVQEARRKRGAYEPLIKELFEAGCKRSAEYLICLVKKEKRLFELDAIRDRVIQDRPLLLKLVDIAKNAEAAAKSKACLGQQRCFELVLEIIQLFEADKLKYEWLLKEIFEIAVELCNKSLRRPSIGTRLYIAQIFFRCAEFYYKDRHDLAMGAKYYEKTFRLVIAEPWKSKQLDDMLNYFTMRITVAEVLCEVLMKYSKMVVGKNQSLALDLAKKAMLAAAECGPKNDPLFYWTSHVNFAEILLEIMHYRGVLEVLRLLPDSYLESADPRIEELNVRVLTLRAYSYTCLEMRDEAKIALGKALALIDEGHRLEQEAKLYSCLGTLHAQRKFENTQARIAFEKAKAIYESLGDRMGQKKCRFLLAKLSSEYRWAVYMDFQRNSEKEYCSLYHLRKWKTQLVPFWTVDDHERKQAKDECYCLLEEKVTLGNKEEDYFKLNTLVAPKTRTESVSRTRKSIAKLEEQLQLPLL